VIAAVIPAASLSGLPAAPDAPPGAGGGAPAFVEAFERAEAPRGKPAAGRGKSLPVAEEGASEERADNASEDAATVVAPDPAELIPVALAMVPVVAVPTPSPIDLTPFSSCRPGAGIHGAAGTAIAATSAPWTPAQGRGDGLEEAPTVAQPVPGGSQGLVAGGSMLDPGLRREGAVIEVAAPAADRAMAVGEPRGTLQPPAAAPEPKAEPQLAALPLTPAARAEAAPLPRITTGRSLRERATELTGPTLAPAPTAPAAFAPVAAQPLDVSTRAWPAAMMARIEALREAADAVDTSIRILPDALGAIDVSVRKDGEVTHVHLAAEQAQTARLLAEAQPKLAELADARGLKLQTSAGGTGSGQPDARGQPQPQQPAAPPPASPAARAETPDHRIA
jgi:flagellar hook-length control protein FliK